MDPFCYVVSEVETTRGLAAFCIWDGEGSTEGKCPGLQGNSPWPLTNLYCFRSATSYLVGPAALRQLWGPGGRPRRGPAEGRGRSLVLVLGPGRHTAGGGGEEAAECCCSRADGPVS